MPQQAWAGSSRGSSAASNQKPETIKPVSVPASGSSVNTTRSEEIAIFKKLASSRPQPPSQPREPLPEQIDKESVSLSTLGFEGQKSNRTQGKGLKGASLNESRRRISNMLGRR